MRLLITLISLFFITGDFFRSGDIFSDTGVVEDSELVVRPYIISSHPQPVYFAFLTDLHVSPGSASDSNLYRLVEEINLSDVDFTVVTGDLSNSGSDAELFVVKKALDKLIKPCYVLPGNHETNWSESAGLTFNKLWGNDHFMFSLKGYLFVGFSTGPFMKMGDGYVKQEDLLWLKQRLQSEKLKDKVLISFNHYPLSDGLSNWLQVTDLLKSFGCRIDLCGHGHRLALFNFDGIPGIMGRALISGNSSIPGYNIVKLSNDSVLIYNKELSGDMGKPVIAMNYLKPDTLKYLPVSPVPDFSVNSVYTNCKVVAELSDTASIFSGPCLLNDTILVYGNSLGWLKAVSTKSCRIIWQKQLNGPVYSTPVVVKDIIVLGTVDGRVIGLNALNGIQLWEVKTGKPVICEGIAENGFVYIGGGDRNFYRIDAKTGNVIWQFSGVQGEIQGKPAICGSRVLFGAWDTYLYCLDINTGTLIWKWNNGKPQKLFSPGNIFPVCSGDKIFIVAPDRYMTAINITTGKEIWRTNMHQVRESMGVSPDGSAVYAKLMNDTVIAVSASADFPLTLWEVDAGFGYEHNPCPVLATKESVIVATRNGLLVAIDPQTRNILWKYKAGNSSVNKVIVDKNKSYWFTLMEGKIMGINSMNGK